MIREAKEKREIIFSQGREAYVLKHYSRFPSCFSMQLHAFISVLPNTFPIVTND
jgi:hypothetical protein